MAFGTANNSINGLGYKLESPIEENLIQLDDSPKHRLRARKSNNMKNDTKNNFNKNDNRFENGQKFPMPTYSIPKSFLQANTSSQFLITRKDNNKLNPIFGVAN